MSVLAAIHLLGIFLSDAPPRLQLLRSLAWSLPIIPAAAWLWNRRVLPSIRLSGILAFSAVVALATLSVGAYHTKLEVSLISYLAGLVGWLVYLIVVVGLAMVVESAWNRAWRQAGRL